MAAAPEHTGAETRSDTDISALETALGYEFQDRSLPARALVHSSVCADRTAESNERLEFLGDRVLALAVAEMLLERFPDEPEGDIARRHSDLVRKETLVEIAGEIDLSRHISAGRNAAAPEKDLRGEPSVQADALEAVIAAVHLDGGWTPARALIARFWAVRLENAAAAGPPRDAKSRLQEWLQAQSRPLPEYIEVSRTGPPQAPVFTIEVRAGGCAARGEGRTKRAAEQDAAGQMLDKLGAGGAP